MQPAQLIILVSVSAVLLAVVLLLVFFTIKKDKASSGKATASTAALNKAISDEKLKSSIILSAIEDGVMLIDDKRNIQAFNQGASALTGWSAEETLTLPCDNVIKLVNAKDEPYPAGQNPFTLVLKEGKPIHDDKGVLMTRSSKRVAISLRVSPLFDEDGKTVTAAVAVFRDVSQERAEEQQRAEFISTASHEMRTPVAAIEGYLALALNQRVSTIDARARGYIEKAHASTKHLGQLFQDLLTSAKAEDGRLSSHPVVLEMSSFLEQLSQDMKFAAEKKGLFSEFILGASDVIDASAGANVVKPLYYVNADPDRLREVITNLFDNACKYTDKGQVAIGLTGNEDIVQFYVKDTGAGIPAEDISHLFQKFYRVDNSATRTIGGTGLGLFIARKIIEIYSGHIWVESELGKGSTFFVNLPRLSSAEAERRRTAEANNQELPPITSLTDSVVQ